MTPDNILTRDEAITPFAKGEKLETMVDAPVSWRPSVLEDFAAPSNHFRRPPEPRREAREGVVTLYRNTGRFAGATFPSDPPTNDDLLRGPHLEWITVREVLPDEVVLQRMTEAEIIEAVKCIPCKFTHELDREGAFRLARALGLIAGEQS